ncbi:MAG TPA: hypothetical protein VH650_03285 [Gaiellaceae bacterium]|jgi:hypothetical protein
MTTCPACHEQIADDAKVCRHCLQVLDAEGWQHDPGRLGADDRGSGGPLEDPPVGPLPVTGSGMGGGMLGSALRLVPASLLARGRRRSRKG